MGEFRMPSLGADMDAGTLIEWRVGKGARVKRGDVVALVETQKGIVEVEIWESGVIADVLVQPRAKVPVGTVLAIVTEEARPLEQRPPEPPSKPAAAPRRIPAPAAEIPAPPARLREVPAAPEPRMTRTVPPPVRASPAARQLARERGVDLTKIHGTGPHEAVTRDDIERALAVTAPTTRDIEGGASALRASVEPPGATVLGPSAVRGEAQRAGMRRAIASAMARSKREIPHYYVSAGLDVSSATRFLEIENARRPVTERLLFAALLLKATALALREVPELNGFFVEDEFRPAERIHIGVAIALRQGGLVAPALHDTPEKSLTEVMAALEDLVSRARTGSLRSSELSDSTITVTSLGDQGADSVFGVIYPPQVAIVGFGTMRERPWAEGGMLGIRPVVTASLAADHRASDGHRGARFLTTVGHLLEEPERL